MIDFTTVTLPLVIFYVFAFACLVQLWYYLFFFSRLAFYKKRETVSDFPPASIIVYARNQEDGLVGFLPIILNQDYPEFEVVVVNDCSYDNTQDILNEFTKKYSNLKVVTSKENKNHYHGKKVALMMGIKGANHELLLLTEASSKPTSKDWLKNMIRNFSPETEIVLGYGGYEKLNGFLNKMIRFDTYMDALQFLSFSLSGMAYKGVGRNLAFKKSLFFKVKGFASHYHVEHGSDDLFVNEAATKHNTKIEVDTNSYTISFVKKNLKDWFFKKRADGSTFKHYTFGSKLLVHFFYLSQYLFFASFIALLLAQFEPIWVLSFFALRFLIQLLIFNKSMNLLSEKDLLLYSPLVELVLLVIYPMIIVTKIFIGKNKFKMTNG